MTLLACTSRPLTQTLTPSSLPIHSVTLCSAGHCSLVRRYATRVEEGMLFVDVADPDPALSFPDWLASLEQGLFERDNGRAIRDGVRLQFGLFFFGDTQIELPFGNGFRCVGGAGVFRLPVTRFDAVGNVTQAVDLRTPPGSVITAGATWNFQFWYRDPLGGGASFNLSDGLQAQFTP